MWGLRETFSFKIFFRRGLLALINLLQTTQNDETLWTAVESRWQIDPGNPAAVPIIVKNPAEFPLTWQEFRVLEQT